MIVFNHGQSNGQTNYYSKALNQYSFDLYDKTKVENENILLSPISTYYALLMIYKGSKKETEKEFKKVLYLRKSNSQQSNYLQNLISKSDSLAPLIISNSIWIDKKFKIKKRYLKVVTDKYLTELNHTDFSKTESAVYDINKWVSDNTKGKIKKIVNTDNLNSNTKLLISNAVYFKSEWQNKFKKGKTTPAIFYTDTKNQFKLDFMNTTENLKYYENDDYQFISKPYKDSDFSFCIILPKKLFGIGKIEKKINNKTLNNILENTSSTKISLSIPKFEMESSYDLSDALEHDGLKSAFKENADFSEISGKSSLKLSKVLHKTWIQFDEEGTEAAAATATVGMVTGLRPTNLFFKADHPFIFFVTDNKSGAIILMGRYVIPTDGEQIEKEKLSENMINRKTEIFKTKNLQKKVLFLLDKKIISQSEFKTIDPKKIESINVYKDKKEVAKYSTGNYDGVVVITLKKNQ